ncbi:MAG: hypothetical protein ACLRW2_06100 [Parasutterella excrementihominis]
MRLFLPAAKAKPVTLDTDQWATGQIVYYVIGDTPEAAAKSPLLELFKKKDIEVLLLSGPIDRWMMQFLTEFQGKKLVNIAKGDLDLGDLADKEEKEEKEKVQAE